MQVAGISALLLCACLALTLYFQHNAKNIAEYSLPSALHATRLANGIEESSSILRSWVLLGGVDRREQRQRVWNDQIVPAMNNLDIYNNNSSQQDFVNFRSSILQLQDSQWWVEDMAAALGNNPARLMYERELLPMFNNIQRSLVGLHWSFTKDKNVSAIQLATAESQRKLSEAIRQLSEAVRTGEVVEIDEFRKESKSVRLLLEQLSNDNSTNNETRSLLLWIVREYRAYESLADQIIAIRESDDWNRALYTLRYETEPQALVVKNALIQRQLKQNAVLHQDVNQGAHISRVSSILMWTFVVGLAISAWHIAKKHANRLATPIMALAKASDQLVDGTETTPKLEIEAPSEIAHLLERFNYMRRQLTSRTRSLENANNELQEYTHIITHDLKAPLINIKGHTGLIKTQLDTLREFAKNKKNTDQTVREEVIDNMDNMIPESMKYIDLSISKTNTLVNGVLDKSRVLFRTNSFQTVDTNKLLNQVTALFSHRFQSVKFQCNHLPDIYADPFLLEHIFTNLIDNALKYLDEGRDGVIEVGGELLVDEARFYIRDNGIGMGDSSVDIFKLFIQAENSGSGSGVGLALVKTMLEKMGGKIWYESNVEFGTTFYFNIAQQQEIIHHPYSSGVDFSD